MKKVIIDSSSAILLFKAGLFARVGEGNPAYLCIAPKVVQGQGAATLSPTLAQSFQGHVKADLVAVFETIGNGFWGNKLAARRAKFMEGGSR